MTNRPSPALTRRTFLASAGAAIAAAGGLSPLPTVPRARAENLREFRLMLGTGSARIAPEPYPETEVWTYNGTVPGPEIRVRQGERLRIVAENGLDEPTTVHWHGMRVPNAMDGVPGVTQDAIAPGDRFVYEFDAVDAGTFWYHPHQRSFEQVARGLSGALVVEEAEPLRVDRDVTWVLDDWRLTQAAAIEGDFGNAHDAIHAGRLGNTVTVNGRIPNRFAVRRGERIRLRLVNVANARIFGLAFAGHEPLVVALDGQPVEPHAPEGGRIVLGPAMRADIVLDMTGRTGERYTVADTFYEGLEYRLTDLAYGGEALREHAPDWPVALAANPLAEPDLDAAERHEVVFNGGMMAGMRMQGADGREAGSMMAMMREGTFWFINGKAATGMDMEPVLTLRRNRSHIVSMVNRTGWYHPMHLHGHSFRVISRNGVPTARREWQDTVLVGPEERVEVALVADNPGDWMFHCHILEHQAAGMMAVIRVA